MYRYSINNVSVGLELSLKHKVIIENKDVFRRLKESNEKIN